MSAVESPSLFVNPSSGTFTSTVKPAGVSVYEVSGATVNAGGNDRCSQPVIPTASPFGSCDTVSSLEDPRPASQLSAEIVVVSGAPHAVGNVRNGRGGDSIGLYPQRSALRAA